MYPSLSECTIKFKQMQFKDFTFSKAHEQTELFDEVDYINQIYLLTLPPSRKIYKGMWVAGR